LLLLGNALTLTASGLVKLSTLGNLQSTLEKTQIPPLLWKTQIPPLLWLYITFFPTKEHPSILNIWGSAIFLTNPKKLLSKTSSTRFKLK